MTDERPYGRHFAPHDKGGYTEEAQPLDCSAKPIDPEEPIQEFDQYDYEPSSGAAEFNACSEYIKSGAEVAGQALGHADQRDSKRSRKRHFGIAVLAALLIIGLISAGIAFFINYSIGEGKRKFEDSMLHMFDKGGSIIEHDGVEYRLNENMVTVAFIGFDGRTINGSSGNQTTGQSDAVIVFALNADTGKSTCILIPRDSWVDVDTYIAGSYSGQQKMQICLQYTYGSSNEESSQLVAQCASRVLSGIPIDYFFTLNVWGVGSLADAIGGVKLTPVKSVEKYDILEGEETILKGRRAQEYVQYRDYRVDNSTLERQERQLSFIKAFANQVLAAASGDSTKLADLYQTAQQYTWTNLGIDEFSYMASIMAKHGTSAFEVRTLEGQFSSQNGHAVLYLDQESVTQTVLDVFYSPVS